MIDPSWRPPICETIRYAIAIVIIHGAFPSASAATISCIQTGDWSAASTWAQGVVPQSSDAALCKTYTVTLANPESAVDQLQVYAKGILNVLPGGSISVNKFFAIGANADVATLKISGGLLNAPGGLVVGYALDSSANAVISGGTISAIVNSPANSNGFIFGPATQIGSAATTISQSGGLLTTNASINIGGQGSARNTGTNYTISGGKVNWQQTFNLFSGNSFTVIGSKSEISYTGMANTTSDVLNISGTLNLTLDANGITPIACANSRIGLGTSSVLNIDGSAFTSSSSTQITLITFSNLHISSAFQSTFPIVHLTGFAKWLTPAIVYNTNSIVLSLVAAPSFSVRAYGAVPNQTGDAGPAIRAAIAAASATGTTAQVLFESGTYPVGSISGGDAWWPKAALVIANSHDLVIQGGNATLMVTDPTSAGIVVNNCQQIDIRNITLDYNPAPFIQSTITAISSENDTFDVKIDPGHPDLVDFDNPAYSSSSSLGNEYIIGSDGSPIYSPYQLRTISATNTGTDSWRLTTPTGQVACSGISVGNHFYSRLPCPSIAAFSVLYSTDISIEHVTLRASPSLGFYLSRSSGLTLDACSVAPAPTRLFSTNRDGIHTTGNRDSLIIQNCNFSGIGDNAIDIHSCPLVPVSSSVDNRTFVFRPLGGCTIRIGDLLEAIHPETGVIIGKHTVTSLTILQNNYVQATFDGAFSPISFSTDGTFSTGDQFYNLSESNNNFLLEKCTFERIFGSPLLLSAYQGIVRDNYFNSTGGHFLPVSSDPTTMWGLYWGFNISVSLNFSPTWAEGPIAEQITILDNDFNGNCNAPSPAIIVRDGVRPSGVAAVVSHDDINIEGNTFTDLVSPAASLYRISNLTLKDNIVQASGAAKPAPVPPSAFILTGCQNPITSGNQSTDSGFTTLIEIRP